MILVGLMYKNYNIAGHGSVHLSCEEAKDIHEAARMIWRSGHVHSAFWGREVICGEFYDTETRNAWAVDANGHTKKNYHRENEDAFRSKWEEDVIEEF